MLPFSQIIQRLFDELKTSGHRYDVWYIYSMIKLVWHSLQHVVNVFVYDALLQWSQ